MSEGYKAIDSINLDEIMAQYVLSDDMIWKLQSLTAEYTRNPSDENRHALSVFQMECRAIEFPDFELLKHGIITSDHTQQVIDLLRKVFPLD